MSFSPIITKVHFALQEPSGRAARLRNYPNCAFRHDPKYAAEPPSDIVFVESVVSDRTHSSVYRAKYPLRRGDADVVMDVVLKFAPTEDIVREASIYDDLEELQGKDVPKCYGMFYGWDQEGSIFSTCLVLEYAGEKLLRPFTLLPLDDQANILTKLANIHHKGIAPRDVAERNVLRLGDDYRIIDLHDADYNHECGWKFDFCTQSSLSPLRPWQQCEILNNNAIEIGYWDNAQRRIRGISYFDSLDSFPPQETIDLLPSFPPEDMEFWYGQRLLEKLYREVHEMQKKGQSLADIKRQQPDMEKLLWGNLSDYPKCPDPDHGKATRAFERRMLMGRAYARQLERKKKLEAKEKLEMRTDVTTLA